VAKANGPPLCLGRHQAVILSHCDPEMRVAALPTAPVAHPETELQLLARRGTQLQLLAHPDTQLQLPARPGTRLRILGAGLPAGGLPVTFEYISSDLLVGALSRPIAGIPAGLRTLVRLDRVADVILPDQA